MYFPEANCPFYRVTVFSNYSPNNVPDISRYWSLMAEVSESPDKPVDRARVVDDVVDGMLATELIASRDDVVDTWYLRIEHGYPTPSLARDAALAGLLHPMMKHDIYSRGRFGAWKYEVSNQDHSLMQGIECVDHLLFGAEEMTLWHPSAANARKPWLADIGLPILSGPLRGE
jgi:protoporphyrinogen oxidase